MASEPIVQITVDRRVISDPLPIQQCLSELLDEMILIRRATTPSTPAERMARRRRAIVRSRARNQYGLD